MDPLPPYASVIASASESHLYYSNNYSTLSHPSLHHHQQQHIPPYGMPSPLIDPSLYPLNTPEPMYTLQSEVPLLVQTSQASTPTTTTPTSISTSTRSITSSSSHNNHQSNCTFKWLEANFQFRSHVSISRSTIYELYQKFCLQNHFVPVCKATFGKIIRIKFPKVKSKRLGARGQSKYHYYNITFKDERKRCSMLINSSPSSIDGDQSNATILPVDQLEQQQQQQQHQQSYQQMEQSYQSWGYQQTSNELEPLGPSSSSTSTSVIQGDLNSWNNPTESSNLLLLEPRGTSSIRRKLTQSTSRLTIFSNRHSSLDSYSHFNLNENDYHAIIQSMLSFMRIPGDQPLINDKFVFINLYKIHCQCLIDSALSGNFAQMRHYLMHFWQQLPRHVTVYIPAMYSLDAHMYSLLEDIYLSNIDTSLDNLKRLNTVAYLIPVWLRKTFEYVEREWWDLVPTSSGQETNGFLSERTHLDGPLNIAEIKVDEAVRWSYRIKFKIDFIVTIKKIDFIYLPKMLQHLLDVFDKIYAEVNQSSTATPPTSYYDLDQSSMYHHHHSNEQLYMNFYQKPINLFHSQPLLWNALLRQFRVLITRLQSTITTATNASIGDDNGETSSTNRTTTTATTSATPPLTGQLIIDEVDRMVKTVHDQLNGQWSSYQQMGQPQGAFHSELCLSFVRLFDDILSYLVVERHLTSQDSEFEVDEFIDEDVEDELTDEENDMRDYFHSEQFTDNFGNYYQPQHQHQQPVISYGYQESSLNQKQSTKFADESVDERNSEQLYLLLMAVETYLMEVCQTVQRRLRYGQDEEGEEDVIAGLSTQPSVEEQIWD